MSSSAEFALREGHSYFVRYFFEGGMRWCQSKATLTEAILSTNIDSLSTFSNHRELVAVDELIEGVPIEERLAVNIDGEWYIDNKEKLTMAQVQAAKRGSGRDVVADLIGSGKPRKAAPKVVPKKVNGKAVARPAASSGTRGRAPAHTDNQRIKVLVQRTVREGTRDGDAWNALKNNMTIGQWKAVLSKMKAWKGVSPNALLAHFVRKEFVKIV